MITFCCAANCPGTWTERHRGTELEQAFPWTDNEKTVVIGAVCLKPAQPRHILQLQGLCVGT